ncbi:MAG: sulfatase [Planctomycetota bacterium]
MHFTPTYADVGFDEMVLSEQNGPGRWDDDYHRHLRAHGLGNRVDLTDQEREWRDLAPRAYWDSFGAAVSDLPEEHHSTTWVGDRAVEALDAWSDEGNLLMAGFVKPHHPFDPPASWARMYDPDALTLPDGWTEQILELRDRGGYFENAKLTEPALRRVMAMYYATISHVDHQVGRMVQALRDAGLYDRTMIVFTADHGEYLGFHHMLLKGGTMYDPLVKVPLIVKWPGGRAAAEGAPRGRCEALVSNVDLAPTILAAVGAEPAGPMAGIDLAAEPHGRDAVFCEQGRGRDVMVRTPDRKLLLRPEGPPALFDLQVDPLEMTDVAGEPAYADDLAALTERARRWALHQAVPPKHLDERAPIIDAPNAQGYDPARREQMIAYFRRDMARADASLFAPR